MQRWCGQAMKCYPVELVSWSYFLFPLHPTWMYIGGIGDFSEQICGSMRDASVRKAIKITLCGWKSSHLMFTAAAVGNYNGESTALKENTHGPGLNGWVLAVLWVSFSLYQEPNSNMAIYNSWWIAEEWDCRCFFFFSSWRKISSETS